MAIFVMVIVCLSLFEGISSCKPIRCHTKYTRANSDGKGNVHYLDRHYLSCGRNHMIKSFRLEHTANRKNYEYKYVCCNTPLPCNNEKLYTPYDIVRLRNAVYLDRHRLSCLNHYMSGFGLQRKSKSDDIRYSYDCCLLSTKKTCYTGNTNFNDDGNGNTIYLDRHTVACRKDYGLTHFRLVRNTQYTKWRYNFTCCKVLQS